MSGSDVSPEELRDMLVDAGYINVHSGRHGNDTYRLRPAGRLLLQRPDTLAEAERERRRLLAFRRAVLNSWSWRLTAPARRAGRSIRRAVGVLHEHVASWHPVAQWLTHRLRPTDAVTTRRDTLWLAYFDAVFRTRRRIIGPRYFRAGPDPVHFKYLIWKIARVRGIDIVPLSEGRPSLAIHHHDTTFSAASASAHETVINGTCTDISKRHVEKAMRAVFGYGLGVDPTTYAGPMVVKSDLNSVHDGAIVEGPVAAPQEGKVYQRLADNKVEPGIVEELRTTVIGDEIIGAFRKRFLAEERFATFADVTWRTPGPWVEARRAYSDDERRKILELSRFMGLDVGELDIVRDHSDGRIYVLDVNSTAYSPPRPITFAGVRAVHLAAGAFERQWGRHAPALRRGT